MAALSRSAAGLEPARAVRLVHLGLGNFHRAHQAWYTQHTQPTGQSGDGWGIAAYTGRQPAAAAMLAAQDGLYVLLTRSPDGDSADIMSSISRAHSGLDTEQWLADLTDPDVSTLTLTITEAGYRRDPSGGLDLADPEIVADLTTARQNHRAAAAILTAPVRIAYGLLARARADAGPLNVISCDNLPDNGSITRRVVLAAVEQVAPDLLTEVDARTAFISSMVDRITPRATDADRQIADALTGFADRTPVVTEPFSEWVITDRCMAATPDWASAGATLVDDVEPFEQRKLWLLNAGHSLLAYLGGLRGHQTIADAVSDPIVRVELESLWDAATPEIALPADDLARYRSALLGRFDNRRIEHRLEQIAMDGSQKVPVRLGPLLRLRLERGDAPSPGQLSLLAGWLLHLRGTGVAVHDPGAEAWRGSLTADLTSASRIMLRHIAPDLADGELVASVADRARELDGTRSG